MANPTPHDGPPGTVTLTYAEVDALAATLTYVAGYAQGHADDIATALRAHLAVLRQRQAS